MSYTFDQYSKDAYKSALYPNKGSNLVYPAIKLAGEAGEAADKVGKHWRNTYCPDQEPDYPMSVRSYTHEDIVELVKELGDVLWYINAMAIELGSSLEEIATQNIIKLDGRVKNGTILGSGDNR